MPKLVQIHDVPDDVHARLKARAAASGRSLSDYLRSELALAARRPSPDELRARLASRDRVSLSRSPAELVREGRAERP
jgi:plasmid stability protein